MRCYNCGSLRTLIFRVKGKPIRIQASRGPLGHEEFEAPRDSRQAAQEGGKVVSLKHRPPLLPKRYRWYSFVLDVESTSEPFCAAGRLKPMKNPSDPFQVAAQCLNRLRHCVLFSNKVKCCRYRPGVAQRVGRGIALLFHDRGIRSGWVVSSTYRPHFTPGKDPVPVLQETGWVPGPVSTGGKSRPRRDSISDRPSHSRYTDWATRPTPSLIRVTEFSEKD